MDPLEERGTLLDPPLAPPAFRGHWSVDLKACGAAPLDESQVWVTASSLNLYETNGRIVRVAMEDEHHAVVTLSSDGGGVSFMAKKGLTLSSDESTLVLRNEEDNGGLAFHRCPAEDAMPTFIPHHTMPPR